MARNHLRRCRSSIYLSGKGAGEYAEFELKAWLKRVTGLSSVPCGAASVNDDGLEMPLALGVLSRTSADSSSL